MGKQKTAAVSDLAAAIAASSLEKCVGAGEFLDRFTPAELAGIMRSHSSAVYYHAELKSYCAASLSQLVLLKQLSGQRLTEEEVALISATDEEENVLGGAGEEVRRSEQQVV